MLTLGVIGIGNAGNQVADLASMKGFPAIALNTSTSDIETLKNVKSVIIGEDRQGSGKDRSTAKSYAKANIQQLLGNSELTNILENVQVVYVVSSTGGGTGSGMTPVLADIISKVYPGVVVITAGILPTLRESVAAQQNTVEYLQELRKNPDRVYDLYDNERIAGNMREVLSTINDEIVETLCMIRGDYQPLTPLASIDERDMLRIVQTPGRLARVSTKGFQEKDIDSKSVEERLLESLKNSPVVEFELDKIVRRLGIIVTLTDKVFKTFDVNIPTITNYIGEPVEGFEHICDTATENAVHLILSGLSIPDDRIQKISQRISEAMEALSQTKDSSILDSMDTGALNSLRRGEEVAVSTDDTVSLGDLFSQYE